MGFIKFLFISSILIAITGVLVQKYSPETADEVVNYSYGVSSIAVKNLAIFSDYVEETLGYNPIKYFFEYQDLMKYRSNKNEQGYGVFRERGDGEVIMSAEELKKYDGKSGQDKIYLAFLGIIFDVTAGKQYYGPDGGYKFFAGRDASRAFVTGDFTEKGLIDDVEGLSPQDYLGIEEWISFYKSDYKTVGKLVGRYYTIRGEPTEYLQKLEAWTAEAKKLKDNEDNLKRTFPQCNSEWTNDKGSRVWCTKKSGGVDRNWVGVPRQLFSPGKSEPRCACVKNSGSPSTTIKAKLPDRGDLDHPHLKEYPNCPPLADSCDLQK